MDLDDEYVMLLWLLYRRWKRKRINRRYWIHPIISERGERGLLYTLSPQLKGDDEEFFNFTRMSQAYFNELLGTVQQELTKENTTMRDSIPPEEKLVIAIR
jgi:hypothetical protein